ncbi:MAG TPA: polymer-forming cytoskeletal protein [Chthonomonadaceae bacterium]|nr:polymer-forming cytoskeletal protein [Chthonomonadaceae bacterium]
MQRILLALVALLSLLTVNVRPARAQGNETQTAEPTAPAAPGAPAPPAGGALTVEAGSTVDHITVRNRPLVVEGHVTHDVYAENSDVTIRPGARIDGHVVVQGGSVSIAPGLLANETPTETRPAPPLPSGPAAWHHHAQQGHDDWFGGQFRLLLLGLISGLVVMLIAPRAAQQVASAISEEPARCLVVGGIGAALLLVVVTLDCALMHSVLKLVWAPFGALILLAPVPILLFAWVCGMRFAGDLVARRLLGRAENSGKMYSRIALGLIAFFLACALLGSILPALGRIALLVECLIMLMGLGAMIVTGWGSDPNWLSRRLRGEARWFSWGRKR